METPFTVRMWDRSQAGFWVDNQCSPCVFEQFEPAWTENWASLIWSNLGWVVLGLSVDFPLLSSASLYPQGLLFWELS